MLRTPPNLQIPLDEIQFSFVRSSGPGGQNVNKVNSKAVLRWVIRDTTRLPDGMRHRFLQRYASRITVDGAVVLSSQRFRDQAQNQRDCLEKLRAMLAAVAAVPKPRKKTKPTKTSIRRRVEGKRAHSQKKQSRRGPRGDE
ncbi:MAG: aminoacyl-tRNA hydrolase [Pirellulales bacterium]|nr:aminoacyl-tRNA hydrolase [Pirellulales bacterium]